LSLQSHQLDGIFFLVNGSVRRDEFVINPFCERWEETIYLLLYGCVEGRCVNLRLREEVSGNLHCRGLFDFGISIFCQRWSRDCPSVGPKLFGFGISLFLNLSPVFHVIDLFHRGQNFCICSNQSLPPKPSTCLNRKSSTLSRNSRSRYNWSFHHLLRFCVRCYWLERIGRLLLPLLIFDEACRKWRGFFVCIELMCTQLPTIFYCFHQASIQRLPLNSVADVVVVFVLVIVFVGKRVRKCFV